MKKMVLKVAIEDEKRKRRAMRAVAAVEGVESVTVDMKERKITVIGEADPVDVAKKLMKLGFTELLSVGSANEEKAAAETPAVVYHHQLNPNYVYGPYEGYSSYTVVRDEDPNGCTIC